MRKVILIMAAALSLTACRTHLKDGEYLIEILTTNDLHGSYFDSTYVDDKIDPSMFAVNYYVDSIRNAVGADNVVLLDNGDFLQGDNAAYYFNYIDTMSKHVFSRIAAHMKYDVVVGGNHDIETGHDVYDKVAAELEKSGIKFLAGNAIRNSDGGRYFPEYTILKKNGVRIAVLGYDNANIKAWLNESLWSGMHFESLLPLVQDDVNRVREKENPDLVIVAAHTGSGSGRGDVLESQGLDLFNSLKGVDVVVAAHDHRPMVKAENDMLFINSGSHARNVGHGVIEFTVKDGQIISKNVASDLIPVDATKADPQMEKIFHEDYLKVKAFTLKEVGELMVDLNTNEAFGGMCDYLNFIHTIGLKCTDAELSIAAPLTANGRIKAGKLIYNDLFTLYPYENQLYVVQLSGKEIKDYLELSYNQWVNTVSKPGEHILRIAARPDPRAMTTRWSFMATTYNFDSVAGLNYTVDVTKPYGSRIVISTLADGSEFDMDRTYKVAMTSYRASGGGDLLPRIGVDTDRIDERVTGKYPEIRELMYDYLMEYGKIDPAVIGDSSVIGSWSFIPERLTKTGIPADLELVYPKR